MISEQKILEIYEAENAEIEENETQAKIYRKLNTIIDKYREIRKYDVGVKTGIILRRNEKSRNYIPATDRDKNNPAWQVRSHLRREYIITGNQLDQLLKDIKRGKVECEGFINPATLDFDNSANERITEITE